MPRREGRWGVLEVWDSLDGYMGPNPCRGVWDHGHLTPKAPRVRLSQDSQACHMNSWDFERSVFLLEEWLRWQCFRQILLECSENLSQWNPCPSLRTCAYCPTHWGHTVHLKGYNCALFAFLGTCIALTQTKSVWGCRRPCGKVGELLMVSQKSAVTLTLVTLQEGAPLHGPLKIFSLSFVYCSLKIAVSRCRAFFFVLFQCFCVCMCDYSDFLGSVV